MRAGQQQSRRGGRRAPARPRPAATAARTRCRLAPARRRESHGTLPAPPWRRASGAPRQPRCPRGPAQRSTRGGQRAPKRRRDRPRRRAGGRAPRARARASCGGARRRAGAPVRDAACTEHLVCPHMLACGAAPGVVLHVCVRQAQTISLGTAVNVTYFYHQKGGTALCCQGPPLRPVLTGMCGTRRVSC